MRFSVQVPFKPDRESWADTARWAEGSGFHSLSIPDHLGPSLPQLAPLIALAVAASMTSTLRLVTTVLDNDFRHPVMLAKEAATLDVLSEGRLDLGMGAGWLEDDYVRTGVASWDRASVRVERLAESLELLKLLLTGEPVTFFGEHYRVEDFRSFPAALQRPLPLMIGASAPRMLELAVRQAQIVNFVFPIRGSMDIRLPVFEQQLEWVRQAGGLDRADLHLVSRVADS